MSSSSEARAMALPELRSGTWTRLGGSAVLGDVVTERALEGLAAETRDAARAQGYAVGWSEGRRAAEAEAIVEAARRAEEADAAEARREHEHRLAVAALGEAAAQVRAHLDDLARAVEAQAAGLACALTAEIIGARLADTVPADVVARVLDVLPAATLGTVRLHPSAVHSHDADVLAERGLVLVADAGLGPADAIVATDDGAVTDLRVDAALARVREVLA